jgi:hypothetical protein
MLAPVSARPRIAHAAGVAGCVAAILLETGLLDGTVVVALLAAWAARVAPAAALADAGPVLAADAASSLARQALLAPTWALVAVAGALRAGSVDLADVRGAHAVAGLALVHGPSATVAGMWLVAGAGALAVASWSRLGAETAAPPGSAGRIEPPAPLRRLEALGAALQAGLVATLVAGPQVRGAGDALPWAVSVGALLASARAGRGRLAARGAVASLGLAAVGCALVIAGGPP